MQLFFYFVDHRWIVRLPCYQMAVFRDCPAILLQFLATALPSGGSFSRLPCHLAAVSRYCPAIRRILFVFCFGLMLHLVQHIGDHWQVLEKGMNRNKCNKYSKITVWYRLECKCNFHQRIRNQFFRINSRRRMKHMTR